MCPANNDGQFDKCVGVCVKVWIQEDPPFFLISSVFPSLLQKLFHTSSFAKKKPVDFDGELKIGDVRYDNITKITIKVQLFWHLQYEM